MAATGINKGGMFLWCGLWCFVMVWVELWRNPPTLKKKKRTLNGFCSSLNVMVGYLCVQSLHTKLRMLFPTHLQARKLCPQTYSLSLPLEWSQVSHIPASPKGQLSAVPLPDNCVMIPVFQDRSLTFQYTHKHSSPLGDWVELSETGFSFGWFVWRRVEFFFKASTAKITVLRSDVCFGL